MNVKLWGLKQASRNLEKQIGEIHCGNTIEKENKMGSSLKLRRSSEIKPRDLWWQAAELQLSKYQNVYAVKNKTKQKLPIAGFKSHHSTSTYSLNYHLVAWFF